MPRYFLSIEPPFVMRKIADRIRTWVSVQLSIASALLTAGFPDSEISLLSNFSPSVTRVILLFFFIFYNCRTRTHSELPLNFLAIPLGWVDRRRKGGKWALGDGARRGARLSCNFPAERYVLRMYDGFRAWNFRRSPLRAHENRHNVRNTRAMHRAPLSLVRAAVILSTTSVVCARWVGLIAGAASLYGVSTLEWKLVAAVCTCCRERLRTVVKAWSMIIMPRILSFIAI